MEDIKYYMLIHNKLEKEGMEVVKFDGRNVYARYGKIPFQISFELCLCHGGRLAISSEHCRFYKRIEHEDYEEPNTNSPETELEYEIENEMIPIIKELKSYVYCAEQWREDNPNNHTYEYFNNIERLSKHILEEDGMDIFAMEGEYIHYYPNPDMASKITIEDFKDGKLYIKREDLRKKDREWKVDDSLWSKEHFICKIFKKIK